jgi:hypothetical protein
MATKVQHSSYWLDQDVFDNDDDRMTGMSGHDDTVMRLMRLAAIRRGISNFVNILTNRNDIPVQFSSGKNSYTDGNTVVIAADEDPGKFDPTVGLALHEAAHIKLSNFDFLKILKQSQDTMFQSWGSTGIVNAGIFSKLVHPELAEINNKLGYEARFTAQSTMVNDLMFIMNILEDRRIDKFVYQTAPGYRPYYTALYDKYFFTGEIGRNLRFNPNWRTLTVENYLNRLLYFFHPANKMDAMPGLEKLYELLDINTIDRLGDQNEHKYKISYSYDDMPRLWKDANLIYAHILKFVDFSTPPEGTPEQFTGGSPTQSIESQQLSSDGPGSLPLSHDMSETLPNLDLPSGNSFTPVPVELDKKGKPGQYNESKADRQLKTVKDLMNGTLKKKKVTKAEQEAISAMEQAQAELVDISGDNIPYGRCIVMRRITDAVLKQDWYPFTGYSSKQKKLAAISLGKRMGAILTQRLQVRNDPMLTTQTRLPQGKIDRRLLAQLGMDIERVFQKSRIDMHRPAMLHLTIDGSGSMNGTKWYKCVSVAVALGYVAKKVRNVDTVISIRGGNEIPIVSVIFDSRKDQFTSLVKNFLKTDPSGATPEGLCFKATLDLVLECTDTHDVYFINFSDGEPSFSYTQKNAMVESNNTHPRYVGYFGEFAAKHTRTMVNYIRERGVKILSYYISDYTTHSSAFKYMYGEDAAFINVNNVTEVLRTLNKLLLHRGT